MIRTSGDFSDECDRAGNQTRRFNFFKAVWVSIRNYMNERIKLIGSKASQEILEKLRNSCNQFRNEIGKQAVSSKDVQGELFCGVEIYRKK